MSHSPASSRDNPYYDVGVGSWSEIKVTGFPMDVDWIKLTDVELLAQCDVDHYRASGPGGQKRNKIESAVRLRHRPTELIVTATESRSQHENRARALRRLREALAFQYRRPVTEVIPPSLQKALSTGRFCIGLKDPDYLTVASKVLDLLDYHSGSVSETAQKLGVTTAHLVSFLGENRGLWRATQEIRTAHGLKPLR